MDAVRLRLDNKRRKKKKFVISRDFIVTNELVGCLVPHNANT